ncbi:hypothetical protein AiwAL_16865 [Acidiphilium sp. AL]|uniref:hypothetical protein n=1 Tax=Acidiphilium sp. AL TaxID=2871704 RepID=UPI0021CAEC4D|nr:hypothetical protein [Acidiphilium sp. AL]MCU4161752.1 hypothetical protein [Acidiphilium sp. AL]
MSSTLGTPVPLSTVAQQIAPLRLTKKEIPIFTASKISNEVGKLNGIDRILQAKLLSGKNSVTAIAAVVAPHFHDRRKAACPRIPARELSPQVKHRIKV